MDAIFNNPIAWAHFRIRGGLKNHFWSTAGYMLLIVSVIGVTNRLAVGGTLLSGWTMALLGLQLAILGLYGSSVVGNAIRRDITAGLLESHRLMPVSSASAILGYLTGPTFQAICLVVANLLIGTVTGSIARVPMDHWYTGNAIIFTFVIFLWVCFAFASFVAKNAFTALFGLIIGGMSSAPMLLAILPALAVLLTPLSGQTIFSMLGGGRMLSPGIGYGLAAQLVFGFIFYRGAMRRYRRDDIPALGSVLGLALLAAWFGTSAIGIRHYLEVSPGFGRMSNGDFGVQAIGSLISGMLIGIVPIAGSARVLSEWKRTNRAAGRALGGRPADPVLVALIASMMPPLMVMAAQPRKDWDLQDVARVAIIGTTFFFTTSYLLRIFYRRGQKAAVFMAVWFIITWLIPLGADALRHNLSDGDTRPFFSLISPIGALIDVWDAKPSNAVGGLVFQVLLAITASVMFYMGEGKRPAAKVSPASA